MDYTLARALESPLRNVVDEVQDRTLDMSNMKITSNDALPVHGIAKVLRNDENQFDANISKSENNAGHAEAKPDQPLHPLASLLLSVLPLAVLRTQTASRASTLHKHDRMRPMRRKVMLDARALGNTDIHPQSFSEDEKLTDLNRKVENFMTSEHYLLSPRFSRVAVLRNVIATATIAAVTLPTHAIPPVAYEQVLAAAEKDVPRFRPPPVKSLSNPNQIALAQHLQKTGAKLYAAHWCSFCLQQRSMFGAVASRAIPYVECAEDGINSQICPQQVEAYPTWEIDGNFYSGMRTLSDLQALSGFDPSVKFPEYVPPKPKPKPKKPPPAGGYEPPAIEAKSTVEALALARHLKSSGAQFFAAYWCKYCFLQRNLFGVEGAEALPYVECAPDGLQSAASKCTKIDAFPTWQIGGEFYGGLQTLEDLAKLSGFSMASASPPTTATTNGEDCAECVVETNTKRDSQPRNLKDLMKT